MKKLLLCLTLLVAQTAIYAQNTEQAIHTEVFGQGEPIILIPGFTVPGEIWNPLVQKLENHYECHVITLAGFGGKAPITFPWLPKVNAALENYIIEKKLSEVTIIGHSLGGTIATWIASRNHSNIKQIIVVDALPASGALMIPNYNPDDLVYKNPYNMRQLEMSDTDFQQMAIGISRGMSLNPSNQQQIKDWILMADRKTYVYGYTDYLKLDLRETLKHISVPVTIIAADKPYGKEMVLKTYKDQYTNLHDYKLIMAENAAHFVMLDQPEWFMDQVMQLLTPRQ